MITLLNENVKHIKFGKGKIISESSYSVDITFENTMDTKTFLFPDSFEKFLILEDELLQKECFELAVEKRVTIEKEIQEKHQEQDRINEEMRSKLVITKKKKSTSKNQPAVS